MTSYNITTVLSSLRAACT